MSARTPSLHLLVVLLSSACSREIVRFDVGPSEIEQYALVTLDEEAMPVRVIGTFTFEGNETKPNAPTFGLESGEDRVLLIGVDAALLTRRFYGFDVRRRLELAMSIDSALEKPHVRVAEHGAFMDARIPDGATLIVADEDGTRPFGGGGALDLLVFSVPIDPEPCGDRDNEHLRPFGSSSELLPRNLVLPGDTTSRRVTEVIRVDEDRVLMLTLNAIFVAHRGRALVLDEAVFFDAISAPGDRGHGMALDPELREDGARTVLVAGGHASRPVLWELALDDRGLHYLRTSTTSRHNVGEGRDVRFDELHRVVEVGSNGLILYATITSTAITLLNRTSRGLSTDLTLRKIVRTGNSLFPDLLAATGDRVAWGDLRGQMYSRVMEATIVAIASAVPRGEVEAWAVGQGGFISRKRGDGDWKTETLFVPPRYYPCAQENGAGDYVLSSPMHAVAANEDNVYVAHGSCNGLLRLQRIGDTLCTSVLFEEDRPIEETDREHYALSVKDGVLLVGGDLGSLFELRE